MKKLLLVLYLGLIVGLPAAALAVEDLPLPPDHGESDKPQPSEPETPTPIPNPK